MNREYCHLGFASDKEFMDFHRQTAAEGDEKSLSIVDTRNRLEQAELCRQTAKKKAEVDSTLQAAGDQLAE